MADVLLIAGSPSIGSRSGAVLNALSERLTVAGLDNQVLSVRDLPAEALIHAHFHNDEISAATSAVSRAHVVIVATPVYKASFAGVLKTFLDLLPQHALAGKAVLPVATGGSPAHLLVIEYALKPVMAALGAQIFLPSLYVQDSQIVQGNPAGFQGDIEFRLQAAVDGIVRHVEQHVQFSGILS